MFNMTPRNVLRKCVPVLGISRRCQSAALQATRRFSTLEEKPPCASIKPEADTTPLSVAHELLKSLKVNRILVLEKITKYDLERLNGLSGDDIRLRFPLAFKTHMTHKKIMKSLLSQLKDKYKIHVIVIKAQSRGLSVVDCENCAFPPDVILSAGGDGTFLEAASLIPPPKNNANKPLWVIGINTDPERSLGALCVSYFERHGWYARNSDASYNSSARTGYKFPKPNKIRFIDDEVEVSNGNSEAPCGVNANGTTAGMEDCNQAIQDLANASFTSNGATDASNIQNALIGANKNASIYDVSYHDYVGKLLDRLLYHKDYVPILRQRIRLKLFKHRNKIQCIASDSRTLERQMFDDAESKFEIQELVGNEPTQLQGYSVPHGAINDVMIADKSFGKTFYALVQVDNSPIMRVKSSGVLITTGTGSSAWAFNVCKLNMSNGTRLIKCLLEHPQVPRELASKITSDIIHDAIDLHNTRLRFDPQSTIMKCIIREGISREATVETSSYFGRQIKLVALAKDAMLYIDGSKIVHLTYGDVVILKTFEQDQVWSCV